MKKLTRKRKNFIYIVTFILLLFMFVLTLQIKTDGMKNANEATVYYRVYTKENGWSRWSKNGITSGNKKNNILNIQIKTKSKYSGITAFKIYNKNWSKYYDSKTDEGNYKKLKSSNIKAIKIFNDSELRKKYQICYRTYNKKNKWLNWVCEDEISGNKNENITAIEIKQIPNNVIKNEYLKDYDLIEISNIGF